MWAIIGRAVRRLVRAGAWAPISVFGFHVLMSRVLHAYRYWPKADIQMHFVGGMAMAYFFSGAFRALPRDTVPTRRVVLLELILAGALTTTTAVLWEFAEFLWDRVYGTNLQVNLENTMQDLAVGMTGALVFLLLRGRALRTARTALRELLEDWAAGPAA